MNTTFMTLRQDWLMHTELGSADAWGFAIDPHGLVICAQPAETIRDASTPLERIAVAIERIATIMGA